MQDFEFVGVLLILFVIFWLGILAIRDYYQDDDDYYS